MERAGGNCDRGDGAGDGEDGGLDKEAVDRQCAAERDKGDWRQCQGEGTTIPRKTHGNADRVGHARATMMPKFEIFSSSR